MSNDKSFHVVAIFTLLLHLTASGQSFTSYFTGNPNDTITVPRGGMCLMGGAGEDDSAMAWFLERANGGDILVLRTSGADGYNDYLYSSLGVEVNSVETIVFDNLAASDEPYIHQKIRQAEAIWFAGGDQWDYIRYWRSTAIDSLINEGITSRHVVIGGTSAGMAIQGKYYFTARYGTVTSSTALANPYNNKVSVDSARFLANHLLRDVITDTHYDNPDRKGRHAVFLARILSDFNFPAKGIACDEYTAVCIDTNGIARVYGQFPQYDDNAYFIQANCELIDFHPELCLAGNALTWNLGNEALKVYRIKGTKTGINTFNLNDWQTGTGGTWLNWYILNGTFAEIAGDQLDCSLSTGPEQGYPDVEIWPNPADNHLKVSIDYRFNKSIRAEVFNSAGQRVLGKTGQGDEILLDIGQLKPGIYSIRLTLDDGSTIRKKFLVQDL